MPSNNLQTVLLGIIAAMILIPVGTIEVLLVLRGQPDVAVALAGTAAGAVVAFFFSHGQQALFGSSAAGQRADLLAVMNQAMTGAMANVAAANAAGNTAAAPGTGPPGTPSAISGSGIGSTTGGGGRPNEQLRGGA